MSNPFCGYYLAVFLIFVGYLLGSIPFGLILARLGGYGDIRKSGSKNIGATNVLRKSKFYGLLTLFFDMGKGVLAIYLCRVFCGDYLLEILGGIAAILGHVFPVWLRFKGGKGVATAIAVLFMTNWLVGIFLVGTWALTFIVTRISGASALVAFAGAPILTHFFTHDLRLTVANSFISALVIFRHKENIKKIISEL
jgi:glycerol-3-phosphate acyltransferase PlsY